MGKALGNNVFDSISRAFVLLKNGWPCVQTFPYSSIEALIENCRGLDPTEVEGYVVRDKFFNRVKVKTPQYVALTHLNTSNTNDLNLVHMLRIVILGEGFYGIPGLFSAIQ
eukprot:TRINITY_DN5983_c0_g1_i3.p1 TRINITY_DN5983_c0_g1~~TRINITY_DN5983_c0_g1_i3.p1  ORF type:complete len:111 (-),score=13.14 TRINITY_DN5983_c0_g1_i3:384-716(-)